MQVSNAQSLKLNTRKSISYVMHAQSQVFEVSGVSQNVCSFLPSQVPATMGSYLKRQLFEELIV